MPDWRETLCCPKHNRIAAFLDYLQVSFSEGFIVYSFFDVECFLLIFFFCDFDDLILNEAVLALAIGLCRQDIWTQPVNSNRNKAH